MHKNHQLFINNRQKLFTSRYAAAGKIITDALPLVFPDSTGAGVRTALAAYLLRHEQKAVIGFPLKGARARPGDFRQTRHHGDPCIYATAERRYLHLWNVGR